MEPLFVDLDFDPDQTADVGALRDRIRRLEQVLAEAQDVTDMGGWEWLLGEERLVCSEPLCEIFGLDDPSQITDSDVFVEMVHRGDRLRVGRAVQAALADGWAGPIEYRIVRPDGQVRWIEVHGRVVFDEEGAAERMWGTAQDITDRRRLHEEIERRTVTDALTGLLTREALYGHLDRLLSDAGPGLVVAVADIDRFNAVNEHHGMATGDELLREVARRLERLVPEGGVVARLAGDIFAVAYREDEVGQKVLETGARWVQRAVTGTPVVLQHIDQLRTGVGIAAATQTDLSGGEVLGRAEAALQVAKTRGPDTCQVYDPAVHQQALDRYALVADLRAAIADGDIQVAYQPVVDLSTGRIRGLEALARWSHAGHGPVSPAVFVRIAEQEQLVDQLDAHVLLTAATQMVEWRRAIPAIDDLRLGVNLSASDLARPQLLSTVDEALSRSGLPPERLVLEITESAVVEQAAEVTGALEELRRWGVMIAIDDFGTGYSSLSRLRELPLDLLKTDRALIRDVRSAGDQAPVLEALLSMARTLDLGTVVEGVETPAQLAVVRRLRDDAAQGHLFSKALPAPDLEALLAEPEFDLDVLLDEWAPAHDRR